MRTPRKTLQDKMNTVINITVAINSHNDKISNETKTEQDNTSYLLHKYKLHILTIKNMLNKIDKIPYNTPQKVFSTIKLMNYINTDALEFTRKYERFNNIVINKCKEFKNEYEGKNKGDEYDDFIKICNNTLALLVASYKPFDSTFLRRSSRLAKKERINYQEVESDDDQDEILSVYKSNIKELPSALRNLIRRYAPSNYNNPLIIKLVNQFNSITPIELENTIYYKEEYSKYLNEPDIIYQPYSRRSEKYPTSTFYDTLKYHLLTATHYTDIFVKVNKQDMIPILKQIFDILCKIREIICKEITLNLKK